MAIMHSEWKDRIRHWIRTLKNDFYEPLGEMHWEMFCTTEHLTPQQAAGGPFAPVKPGAVWGHTWEYAWFRTDFTLPARAEGQRIVMDLHPDGESTLFVNGSCFGTYRASWVDEPHHFLEDNTLTRCAAPGEQYRVLMETYAGHYYPEAPGSACATGPVLPGSYQDPLPEGARRTLGVCTYGIWDEDAYQLYMDVSTLDSLLGVLDEDSLRAAKVAEALERFTLTVDFEQDKPLRTACYRQARSELKAVLEAVNGSTAPVFYAVGNAHLDLAWLWPMAETHRKTERTFAAQLRLLEEYPEYKFIQSQPASYEMCRQHYPELFARILEAIKTGQWIADGAMWVEPDTNMAGGEALIRQLVHGKRYYREVLGTDSQVLWLPDTFGYTAALPQILRGCGVKYLVTQKIFWSYNEGDQFPYHYFYWEGMDGTKVTSFLPTSYTYRTEPEELNKVWKNRVQKRDLDSFLIPFGYGDGGGGPSRDYVEYALRQRDLEGGVKVRMESPQTFFEEMERAGGPRRTYTGELYFSAHRGTYTSQAMVKKNNRRCELAMRELELWSVLAGQKGFSYDLARADALWKQLLLHQFHDILPGSSIARVYVEAEQAFGQILGEASQMRDLALNSLTGEDPTGKAVTVFNSLPFARISVIELPESFGGGAVTAEGLPVPTQKTDQGVLARVALPSCGAVSLLPAESSLTPVKATDDTWEHGPDPAAAEGASIIRDGSCFLMENSLVRARISDTGEVLSFILKSQKREFAASPMNHFRLFKDVPRLFDAWDIDSNYVQQEIPAAGEIHAEISSSGLRAVLSISGRIGSSPFSQWISLDAGSRRLEFDTEIDWRELHRLLKVSFPVDVYTENGINEIQFGYVQRPVHRSRPYDQARFEVCNHRYSALCDNAHGAALLNDCKYGISMNGNALELTLLRAAAAPEMRADNRIHRFRYAFTAWEGSFADCDVVKQGYELNVLPVLAPGKLDAFSAFSVEKENVILETVKPAEDGSGDIILRFYESKKAAVHTDVHCHLAPFRAYLTDMLENPLEELPCTADGFSLALRAFEIKTIRLVRI